MMLYNKERIMRSGEFAFFMEDVPISSLRSPTFHRFVSDAVLQMRERIPHYLQQLETCCLIESPSENAPGLNAMAAYLATLLRDAGMQTTIIEHPGGNAVVGSLAGDCVEGPTCLLLGHHDTVHPIGVAQSRTYRDGDRFYGPGTVDMKAGLLQGIFALDLLRAYGYRSFSRLLFVSVPDEEVSTRNHLDLLRKLAQERPLVLGLEGARSIGTVVTRRKGSAHYRLTARGLAAHAGSSPKKGRNAVLELAHQIVQTQELAGYREGVTINAGPIKGGSRVNIVSDFAEIQFDLRFLNPEDRLAVEARWQELLRKQLVPDVQLTLTSEPHIMQPMVATAQSLAMADQVQSIAEQLLQGSYDPETRGGASDCCVMATEGCSAIDGLGAIGGGAHTAQEYALISPVPERIALLAGLIMKITATTLET